MTTKGERQNSDRRNDFLMTLIMARRGEALQDDRCRGEVASAPAGWREEEE